MPPRIAIFEPEADGHHFVYVRHIVHEMLQRGWSVDLVTTERARSHPAFNPFFTMYGRDVRITPMRDTVTPDNASDVQRLKDQFSRRRDYAAGFKTIQKTGSLDCCFMLNLDRADLPISVLGSPFGRTPFSGFLMGRQFHCPHVGVRVESLRRRDRMAEPVFKRLLRIPTLKRVISVDETLVTYSQRFRPKGWEKVVHVPDAAYIRTDVPVQSRGDLGLPVGEKLLLAYGSLSLRKGIRELLDAVLEENFPPSVVVLLAGKQDEEVKELLRREPYSSLVDKKRVVLREGFIEEELEAQLFGLSDFVWVGYQNWFGMSGVLMQAAAMGKPVVAMHNGLIGYLTETHELGMTAEIGNPQRVSHVIKILSDDAGLAKRLGMNGLAYAEGRTVEAFGRATCDVIEETMA